MRKILFKAKRVDNGKEVVGSLVVLKDKCFIFIETKPSKVKKLSFVTHKLIVECVEVVPETVGQYTGLCDKNGKKIFEGDILCVLEKITCVSPAVETKLNYEVIYNDGSFKTKGNEDADFTMDDMPLQYLQFVSEKHNNLVEVIGNVHDNPELLEVEE